MPYDRWATSASAPWALDFTNSSTGETLSLPKNGATLAHAMRLNAASGAHPFEGLHPDFPRAPPGLEQPTLLPRPAPLATSPGALAEAGDMGDAYGPQGNGVGRAVASPLLTPPPPAPLPPAPPPEAAQGSASAPVVMATGGVAPAGSMPAGPPLQGRINELSGLSADAFARAGQLARRGTYTPASAGGPLEKKRTVEGTTPMDPLRREGYLSTLAAGERAQIDSQQAQDDAQAATVAAQQAAAAGYDSAASMQAAEGARRAAAVRERIDQTGADIEGTKIDPTHLVNSMSTGSKVLLGISLALGAIGARATGKNAAVDVLGQAIDRDLDAQKANLAKKQGQLNHFGQLYRDTLADTGSQVAATAAAKAGYLGQIDLRAKAMALGSGNPVAIAKYEALHAKVDADIAKLRYEAEKETLGKTTQHFDVKPATRGGYAKPTAKQAAEEAGYYEKGSKVLGEAQTTGATYQKTEAEATKASQGANAQTAVIGNTRYLLPGLSPEGLEKVRLQSSALDRAEASLKTLKETAGLVKTPDTSKRADAAAEQFARAMSQAQNEGVTREEDVRRNKENLTSAFSAGATTDLEKVIHNMRDGLARQHDAKPIGAPR